MATEEGTTSTTDTSTETGEDQSQQDQQSSTSETEGNADSQSSTIDDTTQLPESHPLVKSLAAQKQKIADQRNEIAELRANSAKATQLEEDLAKRPTQESLDTLQNRYDRLEAFAQAVGIGKALDSRTFTRDLFETDKDIAELVKEWNRANPSATSTALGSKAAAPAEGKMDPNKLIRIAAGKG